jgi:hypothetical protein
MLLKKDVQLNINETYETAMCLRNNSDGWKKFLY